MYEKIKDFNPKFSAYKEKIDAFEVMITLLGYKITVYRARTIDYPCAVTIHNGIDPKMSIRLKTEDTDGAKVILYEDCGATYLFFNGEDYLNDALKEVVKAAKTNV